MAASSPEAGFNFHIYVASSQPISGATVSPMRRSEFSSSSPESAMACAAQQIIQVNNHFSAAQYSKSAWTKGSWARSVQPNRPIRNHLQHLRCPLAVATDQPLGTLPGRCRAGLPARLHQPPSGIIMLRRPRKRAIPGGALRHRRQAVRSLCRRCRLHPPSRGQRFHQWNNAVHCPRFNSSRADSDGNARSSRFITRKRQNSR